MAARDVEPEPGSFPGSTAARLCNFKRGQIPAQLRYPDHQNWLIKNVVEPLKAGASLEIEVIGMASHLGADGFNQRLSEARAQAVKNFIEEQMGQSLGTLISFGVGESQSGGSRNDDDGFYRAVKVRSTKVVGPPRGLIVVPFTETTPLLIARKPDSRSKGDLDSTPPPSITHLSFVAQKRIIRARGQSNSELEDDMRTELVTIADKASGTHAGADALRDFIINPVAKMVISRPPGDDLSKLVARSPEFASAHASVNTAISAALKKSSATGIVDYHVLAEPTKSVSPPSISYGVRGALHARRPDMLQVYVGSRSRYLAGKRRS